MPRKEGPAAQAGNFLLSRLVALTGEIDACADLKHLQKLEVKSRAFANVGRGIANVRPVTDLPDADTANPNPEETETDDVSIEDDIADCSQRIERQIAALERKLETKSREIAEQDRLLAAGGGDEGASAPPS